MKKHNIMAESIIYRKCAPNFMNLFAVASLKDGEVLNFRHQSATYVSDRLYLYEMKQGKVKKVRMKFKRDCKFIPHRSSLICWQNMKSTDCNRDYSARRGLTRY